MNLRHIWALLFLCLLGTQAWGQATRPKVWFDGLGRSYLTRDGIDGDVLEGDTSTARTVLGGYSLLDLNTHVNPNDKIEIAAMLRLRNNFGGFWGGGAFAEMRQLYARGIVGGVFHYGIGDLNLSQSRFTLHNYAPEGSVMQPAVFSPFTEIINWENFYTGNQWRMQGLQGNFRLNFTRFVQSLDVDGFIARNRAAVWLATPDELMNGLRIGLIQSKYLSITGNYVSLYEVPTTSNRENWFRNRVITGAVAVTLPLDTNEIVLFAEGGISTFAYQEDSLAPPQLDGNFAEGGVEGRFPKMGLKVKVLARYVAPEFRSAGAQTRRFLYNGQPTLYPQLTNELVGRPYGLYDLTTDAEHYNRNLTRGLGTYNPIYTNALPYGDATPNRFGIIGDVAWQAPEQWLGVTLNVGSYREVLGQGTAELRQFLLATGTVDFNLHKLLEWKKALQITLGTRHEQATRPGNAIENTKLTSTLVEAGLAWEVFKRFDVLAGAKLFSADGNDYLATRDAYGEVINYTVLRTALREQLISGGIRYRFTDAIYATVQYNQVSVADAETSLGDYSFNRILFLFNISF